MRNFYIRQSVFPGLLLIVAFCALDTGCGYTVMRDLTDFLPAAGAACPDDTLPPLPSFGCEYHSADFDFWFADDLVKTKDFFGDYQSFRPDLSRAEKTELWRLLTAIDHRVPEYGPKKLENEDVRTLIWTVAGVKRKYRWDFEQPATGFQRQIGAFEAYLLSVIRGRVLYQRLKAEPPPIDVRY